MALTNECVDLATRIYWADECEDARKAIDFAVEFLTEENTKEFLDDWRARDVSSWPEFIEFVQKGSAE